MALKKTDLLLLLTEMQDQGKDVKAQINSLMRADSIPLDVLKFINDDRSLDIINFYEHVRKNYNQKRSNLYGNIVKEVEDPQKVLTTLSAMLTQILLWSKKLEEPQLFLKHSRAKEITIVLGNYFKDYDITQALQLMKLIKADLVCLEMVSGHRA